MKNQIPSNRPLAVLISDVHFTPQTLELASQAFRQAQGAALELEIPLIICGDTLDTKDIMRARCVNKIIDLVKGAPELSHFFLVGNHDLLNEKSTEHSLRFLNTIPNSMVIDTPTQILDMYLIPYQADPEKFLELTRDKPGIIICHQGVKGANMGHYVQDKTSVDGERLGRRRIISGHYHARQDIELAAGGLWSYIGNPYTLSFGEANDPEKGFQILKSDGSLEFVPTNLRKHIIIEMQIEATKPYTVSENMFDLNNADLIWAKVKGSYLQLEALDKRELGLAFFGHSNFRMDKIPTDTAQMEVPTKPLTNLELLDSLIQNTDESAQNKDQLKALARELLDES